jgi:hypothetical protein
LFCWLYQFFVIDIFRSLLFLKHHAIWKIQKIWQIGPKFCESQMKKLFVFYWLIFQKSNPCLHQFSPQKFTTKVTLLYSNWQSHWLGNLQSIVLLHRVGRRWNAAGWNRIRHHFSVWMTNWKTPPIFRLKQFREIDASYLCLQQFDKFWIWRVSNEWPETETNWIYRNLFEKTREITSVNLLHQVGKRWNVAGWNRIRHHFSVWQFVLEIGYWGQNRVIY